MTRKYPASTVDRSLAARYLTKANRFKVDAENMAQLSDDFSGNGVAVLCVHAAISYGDAIAADHLQGSAGARRSAASSSRNIRAPSPRQALPCMHARVRGCSRANRSRMAEV